MIFVIAAVAVTVPGAIAVLGFRRLEAMFAAQTRATEIAADMARRQWLTMRQLELGEHRTDDTVLPGYGSCHGRASMLGGFG